MLSEWTEVVQAMTKDGSWTFRPGLAMVTADTRCCLGSEPGKEGLLLQPGWAGSQGN